MQWILDNWLLVLLVGGMIAMHLGHGMHGSKGDHGVDEDCGHGACKKTGKKCCGDHKKEPQIDAEAKPASASKPLTGTSKIPKISYSADEAEDSGVL